MPFSRSRLLISWMLSLSAIPCCATTTDVARRPLTNVVYVDRTSKQLWVVDANQATVLRSPVAIGRGGLKEKKSMDDFVTPTGKFAVDLILYKDKKFNKIAADDVARYRGTRYFSLVDTSDALFRLFSNMNKIDFDGDGKSDRSYGDGYIGLTAISAKVVTGPKMRSFGRTPYWYSIALHGTNEPGTIGGATSGGCVHLPADVVSKLVAGGLIDVGTTVVISDGIPACVQAHPFNK